MRRSPALRALSALLVLCAGVARAQERPGRDLEAALIDLAARARERTVLIYGVIGLGSGAIVDASGVVVTNAHVVAGARYALVQWPDGTSSLCRQRGIDYTRDLAVLEPVEPQAPRAAFALAAGRPKQGEWVVALGFPGGLQTNGHPTVSLGRVLAPEQGQAPGGAVLDYSQALRHDAPIFSGNSGGPLVDLEGRLVGINGAVDLERAVSLTIPADVVAERLDALEGGVIVLPGGRSIDPEEVPLLRGLYRLLDPLARRLPEQIAEASRRAASDATPTLPGALAPEFDPAVADRLATLARRSPREAVLDGFMQAPAGAPALALEGGGVATRVGAEHAVCKASYLQGDHATLQGGVRAPVLARSEADDLALLRVPPGAAPLEAALRPVGSFVQARDGASSIAATGIVTVEPRRASATLAAQIRSGGVPEAVERAIDSFEGLVTRLGVEPLKDLVEQIRKAIEARKAFAAGTPPRGYAEVLAVDAPVRPSHMGAPVLDREGRLVGVAVGVQHHGTTYVVPVARVRAAFAEHLGGTRWPERIGEARLY